MLRGTIILHARSMAKIIYTIKIALFRNQLKEVFKPQMLDFIQSLATLLSLFYAQQMPQMHPSWI